MKFELNLLRNKKVTENLIFDGTSGLKLEMTSYSDNAYNVTNFCCFEKFFKFHCCQTLKGRVKPGGLFAPVQFEYPGPRPK